MGAVKSMFGIKSGKEKAAEAAQAQAVNDAQVSADADLNERKERMNRKRVGRASLLSGTELGTDQQLSKTLG